MSGVRNQPSASGPPVRSGQYPENRFGPRSAIGPASSVGSTGPSTSWASSIMSPTGSPTGPAALTAARTSVAARSAAARTSATPRVAAARTSEAARLATARNSATPAPLGTASPLLVPVSGAGSFVTRAGTPAAGVTPPPTAPSGRPSRSTRRSSIPGSGRPTEPGAADPSTGVLVTTGPASVSP